MSNEKLEDFGEHIAGAKKETYFRAIDLTREEVKSLPLSKLWTDKDIKAIEDINIRAVAFALKDSLPTKPRSSYKLNFWLNTLYKHQVTVVDLLQKNNLSYTNQKIDEIAANSAKNKAYLLPNIPFDDWKRIGKVNFYQSIDSNSVRLAVQIDNKEYSFHPNEPANLINFDYKKIIDEFADDINATLKQELRRTNSPKQITARSFDIYTRRRDDTAFICAKTDRQKTPLIEFETLEQAREYKKDPENIAELSRRWTAHREQNSITKSDMRNAVNEERTGESYRDHDITPDEFMATFGIRGGQFGNWVTGDERQQMLNATYDGFMDLSKALNIEPKAIGLNGTLGIAFGARGSGQYSAHYEARETVINLTKTRGAGSLAHEWWHALDHYMKNGDDLLTRHLNANSTARHQELIAPVRELVKDIHKSELYGRSQKADAYRSQPYFATDVEMTARAFEGHIQHTLSTMGIKNDFLVNIKAEKDWQKNLDAYPYPRTNELEAFGKTYNAVFDTLKEVDKEFVPTHYEPEPIIHADTLAVQEIENKQAKIKETRTSWGDFPPVISNGAIKDLSKEPEYIEAKSGDFEKSAQLVKRLLKDETIQEVKKMIGDNKPIIVPILSEEATGKNRIPQATAYALAKHLGLQVDSNIYQLNTAKRTNTGIYHRYVAPPEFAGQVKAGQSYLIVDDTLSVGGTIATLKGYIENQGGKVIGATVMTAYDKKMDIIIKPNMLQSLENKQGLKEYWFKEFGYDIDKLTQQEAGHLKKPTLEQISERVQEARHALEQQKETSNEQHSTSHETQQREVHQAPAFEPAKTGGTDSLQQTGGAILQSVLPNQETNHSLNSKISTQNIYINCPYAEKDQAKALGAKWDNINKSWYVPQGSDLSKFEKWLVPAKEKATESPAIAPTPQGKTYLYTTPSDNEAIQKLKADGIVKFDLPNKVWYTLEPENPQVKQWLHPAHVPSAEEAFAEHLRANGISLDNGHPIADGRPHRLSNDGSNDKNVMYQLYRNDGGIPAGRITNFSRGGTPEKWVYPAEYIAVLKNIEAVNVAKGLVKPTPSVTHSSTKKTHSTQDQSQKTHSISSEQQATYNKTASRVAMVMQFAPLAQQHEYLDRKQVTHNNIMRIVPDKSQLPPQFANDIVIANDWKEAQALRNQGDERMILQKGNLMVPQFNAQGELRSFETIGYQGAKYALKDGEKQGLSLPLGNIENGKPIIITEGYATGATLHEQTNRTVLVAFGKGGLLAVAQQIREHCPDSKIYIGADNDHTKTLEINPKTGEPRENDGLVNAQKVAEAVPNTHVLVPQFATGEQGKDWNDVYVDKGVDEFKRQIKEQLNQINPPKEQAHTAQREPTIQERLNSDFIKQNYPQMSDENIKAIQAWKEVITHSEKYAPETKENLLKRLADHIPSYANGEQLPLPAGYEQQHDMGKQTAIDSQHQEHKKDDGGRH